jgi:hypothetical protein
MRDVTISCDLCRMDLPLEQAKEALIETGNNAYHLYDLCAPCLDNQLQSATSRNDSDGYRQTAAVLLSMKDGVVEPQQKAS